MSNPHRLQVVNGELPSKPFQSMQNAQIPLAMVLKQLVFFLFQQNSALPSDTRNAIRIFKFISLI